MKGNVLIGGFFIGIALYLFVLSRFQPEKISPKVSLKTFRWLTLVIFVGAVFLVFADFILPKSWD